MIGRSMSRSSSGINIGLAAVVETTDDIHSYTGQPQNLEDALDHIELLQARVQHAEEERRRCSEAGRDIRGAVRVLARVRPALDAEEDEDTCLRIVSRTQLEMVDQPRVALSEPRNRASSRMNGGDARRSSGSARSPDALGAPRASDVQVAGARSSMSKSFFFDQLLGPEVNDDQVFATFMEDISAALDGEPVSILAYGATGSGKTHTMSGLLARLANELEQQTIKLDKGGLRLELGVQMVEVYNEQVRDLLVSEPGLHSSGGPMRLQSTASAQSLHGASHRVFGKHDSITEGLNQILNLGFSLRATHGTAVHSRSSRSHVVLALTLTTIDRTTGDIRSAGKLSFVDLAGNERVKKSEVEGDRLKEAQHINKSLSALVDVVVAKEKRVGHVPFRNSKLTHILQDTLDDPCARIVFIATLPPGRSSLNESVSTLQFSMRLNSLALQSLQVAAQSREEIRAEYRGQIEMHKRVIEDREEKIRDRDILLEDKSREVKELKQIIAKLTQAQQKDKAYHQYAEGSSPSSPVHRHPGRSHPVGPASPHDPRDASVGKSTSVGRKMPGVRSEDRRESSAGSTGRKVFGERSEDPGQARPRGDSRDSSRQNSGGHGNVSAGKMASLPGSREAAGRGSTRREEPASPTSPHIAQVESRGTIALTYSYSDHVTKTLADRLTELREEAGISELDWTTGLSIIDTWGDEVDLNYHIFKIQFPVNARFRAQTATATFARKAPASPNKGVPNIKPPQGTTTKDGPGARERSTSASSQPAGSYRRNTSPREYSVKATSPERAFELTNGNLPPPIDSPGCPHSGGYQEITSVVRMGTGDSDDSDVNEIRQRLMAAVKCASTKEPSVRTGSADAKRVGVPSSPGHQSVGSSLSTAASLSIRTGSAEGKRVGMPSSNGNTTPVRTGNQSTASSQSGANSLSVRTGSAEGKRVGMLSSSGNTTPVNKLAQPPQRTPPPSPMGPTPLYGHSTITPPPRSSSLGQQPGRVGVHPGTAPQVQQQQRTGSHSPRLVQPSTVQPGIGSYASLGSSAPGTPSRSQHVPHSGPRIASRSPPHHG